MGAITTLCFLRIQMDLLGKSESAEVARPAFGACGVRTKTQDGSKQGPIDVLRHTRH